MCYGVVPFEERHLFFFEGIMKNLAEKHWENRLRKELIQSVRCSKGAENFDEKYYQRLYRERYKKFCQSQALFEDLSELKEDLLKEGENLEDYDFDLTKKRIFSIFFYSRLKTVLGLPECILEKVADVRVFALGRVSKKVKTMLKDYYDILCLIEKK